VCAAFFRVLRSTLPLGLHYPELTKRAVVCVTELMPREEIERLATAIKRILETPL
jgi:hypothetical protein